MASVRGRVVQWTHPATRKRLTKTLASPALAKRFASDRETEAELVKGRFLDPQTLERGRHQWTPISQVIDEYEQELVKRRSSVKHRKETVRLLTKLAGDCKYQTISDIDAGSLDTFLKGVIRQGLSARTHNAYLKAIGALCRWLLGYQRIERDPTTPIRSMDVHKDKRQTSRAMTFDEVEALHERCISNRLRSRNGGFRSLIPQPLVESPDGLLLDVENRGWVGIRPVGQREPPR